MLGIYCYIDKKDDSVVYIGKDSNIEKNRRHKDHTGKWAYNIQQINRVIQNNPNRYEYKVLEKGDFTNEELNNLEKQYISTYSPLFNFTQGGDGMSGFKHSEKSRKKMRESHIGQKVSKETREKQSKRVRGKNHPMYGKHHSKEVCELLSQKNKNKFATLRRNGFDKGKQVYMIYRNQEIIKRSVYPLKLLDWFTINFPNEILILNTAKGDELCG